MFALVALNTKNKIHKNYAIYRKNVTKFIKENKIKVVN